MTQNPSLLFSLLAFILVLGPLVFVHEFGHYYAGRIFGVKAEVFSIGFGREIFGITDKRGTRWKFAWLPLGGYVKFAGDMNAASQPSAEWLQLPPAERAKTFPSKPLWQRAIIVAAGPITNFVLAIAILGGFALAYGDSRTPATARGVVPGSPAAVAGIKPGDRIVTLDGRSIAVFDDLVRYVTIRPGETVSIGIDRNGTPLSLDARIAEHHERDRFGNDYRLGRIGIAAVDPVRVAIPWYQAPVVGVKRTIAIVDMMVESIGQIITGRRSVKELGGPVKIAQVAGQQLSLGWEDFVGLAALISINLGFINLLPVPMLDGGHLLFYAVEAIRRRPVEPVVQEWAFRGGLAMILALMLLVTFNDLLGGFAG